MPSLVEAITTTIANREPLTALRIELAKAEADLNGIVARIAAGHLDHGPDGIDPTKLARRISEHVYRLRHRIDEARFAALRMDRPHGARLCTNDPDDMGDALAHALDRLRYGDDDEAAFRAPAHAADVARGLACLNGGA